MHDELPPTYLNKQRQALMRAGLLESLPSARGGFREICAVQASMQRAELAWRRSLSAQTVADVRAEADLDAPTIAGVAGAPTD